MKSAIRTFAEEEKLWRKGCALIGVDEAGRGPLAGPVVAAAVCILPPNAKLARSPSATDLKDLLLLGVADSKKLTPQKREAIYEALTAHPAVRWAVGMADEKTIDRINILRAALRAMRAAVAALRKADPQSAGAHVFIDGKDIIPDLTANQTAVINGDGKVFSIAAASVIAKVTRDRIMTGEYAARYPQYDFIKHKGYGTKLHYARIAEHGISPVHRKSFLKKISI